jgi:hypothetical protein
MKTIAMREYADPDGYLIGYSLGYSINTTIIKYDEPVELNFDSVNLLGNSFIIGLTESLLEKINFDRDVFDEKYTLVGSPEIVSICNDYINALITEREFVIHKQIRPSTRNLQEAS